jgi:ATP-dependent protease ClpP protease subunit
MHHLLYKNADGSYTLLIHGYIGRWSTSAENVRSALAEVAQSGATSITISIHSPGGDVFEGWAIYNTIRSCGLAVTTRVDGIAASMASIIMLAGSRVELSRNCLIMIHDPWSWTEGTAAEMRKTAELLEKIAGILKAEYVRRTGLPDEEIEATAKRFADAIVDGQPVEDMEAWASLDFDGLKRRVAAMAVAGPGQQKKQNPKPNHQDMKALAAQLGLPPTATEAEIAAAIAALAKQNGELAEQAKLRDEHEAKRAKAEVAALIDAAVKDGRCVEAERGALEQIGALNIAVLRSTLELRQPMGNFTKFVLGVGGVAGDRQGWSLTRWQKEDPAGLAEAEEANPGFVAALRAKEA